MRSEVFGRPWCLYVLHQGPMVHKGRTLRKGAQWGAESPLLASSRLLDTQTCVAMTYSEVVVLRRAPVESIALKYLVDSCLLLKTYCREPNLLASVSGLGLNP